jgi:hypothetical protein
MLHVTEVAEPGAVTEWITQHAVSLHDHLLRHGAVLIRGLGIRDAEALARVAAAFAGPPMPEREAFALRQRLNEAVVSSLQWPPDQPMCMHHEMGHARLLPRLLTIGCLYAPARGGVTGLVDARAMLAALPAELVKSFTDEGWLLDRAYHGVVGMRWQDSLDAPDRATAERYAADNGIALRWLPDGSARTSQRRPAVVSHPITGEPVWFNEIAFLNEWTLDPIVREYMVGQLGADGLPFKTRRRSSCSTTRTSS